MKRIFTILALLAVTLYASAQELPKPSPQAKVMQRVGLNDITVEYSRPGIKGREIWGELVPYGELWRAGANKATILSLSAPAMINGNAFEAGSYSLFILPQEEGMWTVIINRETELWGTSEYDKAMNIAEFEVEAVKVNAENQFLEYRFTEVDMNTAKLVMDWAGMQVEMRIETDPIPQVMKNIETALETSKDDEKWKVYRSAAGFAMDANLSAKGIEWIQQSLKLKDNWYSHWIYADLLAQKKDYDGAIKQAEKAIELGEKDAKANGKEFKYAVDLNKEISGWKKM